MTSPPAHACIFAAAVEVYLKAEMLRLSKQRKPKRTAARMSSCSFHDAVPHLWRNYEACSNGLDVFGTMATRLYAQRKRRGQKTLPHAP